MPGKNSSRSALHMQLEREINISHGSVVPLKFVGGYCSITEFSLTHNVGSVNLGCNPLRVSYLCGEQMKEGLSEYILLKWAEPHAGPQGLRHREVKAALGRGAGRSAGKHGGEAQLRAMAQSSSGPRWNVEQCRNGPLQFRPVCWLQWETAPLQRPPAEIN